MSRPGTIIEAQLQNMVEAVNSYRDERCARLHDQASEDARKIIRAAFTDARRHMHTATNEGRERIQREIAKARAKIKTEQRLRRHQRDQAFLDKAWQALHGELLLRWENDASRNQWVKDVIAQAGKILPAGNWRVEHPSAMPPQTLQLLLDEIKSISKHAPEVRPAESIAAGIRIESESAWVDGTLEGLLEDRERLSSELLALQYAQLKARS